MDEKRGDSKLTYKQIKALILIIPTVTVGLWEYIRHEYLLPYISMELGNWLTPIIVLFVTFTLLTRFFKKMECIQEQLRAERAEKAMLEERERIASELHDGLAQSLFLLSIKIQQLDQLDVKDDDQVMFEELKQTIHHIHDYVRQGIHHLKVPTQALEEPWVETVHKQIHKFEKDTSIPVTKHIVIKEDYLSTREKIELTSCIGEALMNIHKHAQATEVEVTFIVNSEEKSLIIRDNGKGFKKDDVDKQGGYGLQMMHDRCKRINWTMDLKRLGNKTALIFRA
ncbi:MAG TPA: histidine kinase [Cerasibacillus sp.]|uniref:sensor histidine kinase n=1 Tax=Cerasibacillus sp. TaxID=2498711 RepID=UPI002F3FCE87